MKVCLIPNHTAFGNREGGVKRHIEKLGAALARLGVRFVSDKEADVVHVQSSWTHPQIDIYTCHGGFLPPNTRIHQQVLDNIVAARRVIVVAQWIAGFFGHTKVKAIHIPNGVDLAEMDAAQSGWAERYGLEPGYVLWAKNQAAGRGLGDFLKLVEAHPDRQFVSTFGPEDKPNLRVAGLFPYHEMLACLKDCGVYVSTGTEVAPIQLLEAMALSKPVLAIGQGGVHEVCVHRNNAYLAGDLPDFLAGFEECWRKREEWGRNSRLIAEQFNWERIAKETLALYEEVLEEKRGRRPKVSVVVPSYNLKRYLPECLESIETQSYKDFECIVVDDRSTDGSLKVARDRAKKDRRFRVLRHKKNRGLVASLNDGFEKANGDYLLILSADDMVRPDILKKMITALEPNRYAAVASCGMEVIVQGQSQKFRASPLDWERLKRGNCFPYCALFRREVFERTGGFKEMNPSYEDWEFWLHAAELGFKGVHLNEPLFVYRKRRGGRDEQSQPWGRYLRQLLQGHHPRSYGPGMGWVTFVVPSYSHVEYLDEALGSIEGQIYPHWKAVVVDDGSPDDVAGAMAPWIRKYPDRMALIRQENRGLAMARNAGIAAADTEWIVPLDEDDLVEPDYLKETINAAGENQYAYTDVRFSGDASGVKEMPDFNCAVLAKRHLHACTILFRKAHWARIRARNGYGYHPNMAAGWEDYDFAVSLAEVGICGVRVPKPLFIYRRHGRTMMHEAADQKNELTRQLRKNHPDFFNGGWQHMGCCGRGRGGGGPARRARRNPSSAPRNPDPNKLILVRYMGRKKGKITGHRPNQTFSAEQRERYVPETSFDYYDIHPQFKVKQ